MFIPVYLPDDISRGLEWADRGMLDVVRLGSGYESRNTRFAQPLRRASLGMALETAAKRAQMKAIYRITREGLYSFGARDWSDYEVLTTSQGVFQDAGGGLLQFAQRYTEGSESVEAIITLLESSSIVVYDGAVQLTLTTDYTFNAKTGILTPVGGSQPDGWTGRTYVRCCFDMEELRMRGSSRNFWRIEDLSLREVPLEEEVP